MMLGTKPLMLLSRCEMPVRFVERKFMMSARSKLDDESTGSLLTKRKAWRTSAAGVGGAGRDADLGATKTSPDSN